MVLRYLGARPAPHLLNELVLLDEGRPIEAARLRREAESGLTVR